MADTISALRPAGTAMRDDRQSVDLRQLRYFLAVAETGSISGAAARLGLSRPSLSEALTRLEKLLTAQLVIRRARGVKLTEAGATFAGRGREILDSMDHALSEVRQLSGDTQGDAQRR